MTSSTPQAGRLGCSWCDSAFRASLGLKNYDLTLLTSHGFCFFFPQLQRDCPLVRPPSLDSADLGWKPGSWVIRSLLLV